MCRDINDVEAAVVAYKVGRCRLPVSKPELKARLVSALKLRCDESLSNVAFKLNVRRYNKALGIRAYIAPMLGDDLQPCSNYIPLARDAAGRNAQAAGCDCGAMCGGGMFRTAQVEPVRCRLPRHPYAFLTLVS